MNFTFARMLIDTQLKNPIHGHVVFVLGNHHFTLRVLEVLVYPSTPCSLASAMETAMLVVLPSSSEAKRPSMGTRCQSCAVDGKAIICSTSLDIVINEYGKSQVSEAMGPKLFIEHIPNVFGAPKKPPRSKQKLVLEVQKNLGLLDNGSLSTNLGALSQASEVAVHELGLCSETQNPTNSSLLYTLGFEPVGWNDGHSTNGLVLSKPLLPCSLADVGVG